ncbi:type II toxin-antitoxin system PemK/MazF family toxin [Chelatococcus daeguensis]|uniref:type II toxin-antitoxin system PemK/MazF family toxin n=1 Tax=Chelatococcus daeguensis TaxID=444444 RepID=UPI0007ABD9BD|nr:type II toxin-antitoxin system PemK/MazF family toxin [Chelatococcus daeguensis]KZE35023.1 growth inhibitor PemK [Chelatococcus daeguensis]MBM3083025.1 type II toxin-antitoxin system PemK/MazF family toxin [Chelatococcus daeguensis]
MRRGNLVTVALPGAYGKLRPALIIQSDLFSTHPSFTLLPVTSELVAAPLLRITVEPNERNGLQKVSQIMVDKAHTVPRGRLGQSFGRLDETDLLAVNRALALFLGFA